MILLLHGEAKTKPSLSKCCTELNLAAGHAERINACGQCVSLAKACNAGLTKNPPPLGVGSVNAAVAAATANTVPQSDVDAATAAGEAISATLAPPAPPAATDV